MNKTIVQIGFILLLTSSLPAQTVILDNGIAKLGFNLQGGIITELGLYGVDLNPMGEYGHFICFDRWDPISR